VALDKPQQRIPLGEVTINGVKYPVQIATPWYKVFFSFFNALGGAGAPSVPDLDAGLQYDVREADWAELAKRVVDIERDQWTAASPADVAQVAARVDAFAADEPAHLLAHIAELSKRIADVEAELSASVSLHAQVAQLAARLSDAETDIATAATSSAQVAQLAAQIKDLQTESSFV
jgi:hypothetical protein